MWVGYLNSLLFTTVYRYRAIWLPISGTQGPREIFIPRGGTVANKPHTHTHTHTPTGLHPHLFTVLWPVSFDITKSPNYDHSFQTAVALPS